MDSGGEKRKPPEYILRWQMILIVKQKKERKKERKKNRIIQSSFNFLSQKWIADGRIYITVSQKIKLDRFLLEINHLSGSGRFRYYNVMATYVKGNGVLSTRQGIPTEQTTICNDFFLNFLFFCFVMDIIISSR